MVVLSNAQIPTVTRHMKKKGNMDQSKEQNKSPQPNPQEIGTLITREIIQWNPHGGAQPAQENNA